MLKFLPRIKCKHTIKKLGVQAEKVFEPLLSSPCIRTPLLLLAKTKVSYPTATLSGG